MCATASTSVGAQLAPAAASSAGEVVAGADLGQPAQRLELDHPAAAAAGSSRSSSARVRGARARARGERAAQRARGRRACRRRARASGPRRRGRRSPAACARAAWRANEPGPNEGSITPGGESSSALVPAPWRSGTITTPARPWRASSAVDLVGVERRAVAGHEQRALGARARAPRRRRARRRPTGRPRRGSWTTSAPASRAARGGARLGGHDDRPGRAPARAASASSTSPTIASASARRSGTSDGLGETVLGPRERLDREHGDRHHLRPDRIRGSGGTERMSHLYDRIGDGYAAVRREDPRSPRRSTPRSATRAPWSTSARAPAATSRATATSSPSSRRAVMLAQRPVGAAPAVQATRRGAAVRRRRASTPRWRSSATTTGPTARPGCASCAASRAAAPSCSSATSRRRSARSGSCATT